MKNPTVLIFLVPEIAILIFLICLLRTLYKIKKSVRVTRQQFAHLTRPMFYRAGLPPYIITEGAKSIICLYCGWESYSLNDVANKYCGHCHVFIVDKYENEKSEKGHA